MIDMTTLSEEALDYFAKLRMEAAKYRHQRNAAQKAATKISEELGRNRITVASLREEVESLKAKLEARTECRECHCQARADANTASDV